MLILRRKKNESILIGKDIRITVIETAGDGVRLAIDAPKHVSILREELSLAEEENRQAASAEMSAVLSLQEKLLKSLSPTKNSAPPEAGEAES